MAYTNCEPGDNILDSRDIIRRYEELKSNAEDIYEAEIERLLENWGNDQSETPTEEDLDAEEEATRKRLTFDEFIDHEAEKGEDYAEEYIKYRDFVDEAESEVPDWSYGATLIHEDYFEEYAEEYANEVMDIKDVWPYNCIDWEKAAQELQYDYSQIEWDGHTYYHQ